MITVLCLFMILVELYHFLCHNKVRLVTKTFFDRMTFFSRVAKMTTSYYAAKDFAKEHSANRVIAEFMEQNEFKFDRVGEALAGMPSAMESTYYLLSKLKAKTVWTIIVYCVVELAYFAAFVWLAFLLPVSIAPVFCVLVLSLSAIHAYNERGEQLRWEYWPMIDATICICLYTCILVMFGTGLS